MYLYASKDVVILPEDLNNSPNNRGNFLPLFFSCSTLSLKYLLKREQTSSAATTNVYFIIIIIIIIIICECSKLAQNEYKARHEWVGKVIHWKMCKKFKFDHANKWHMHNPAPVLENDTQTPMGLCYTNGSPNLGQKTKPYNNQQKKKENLQNCNPGWPQNKTERMLKER